MYVISFLLLYVSSHLCKAVNATPSYAYCSEMYGNRTYISEANMFEKYPPHLLSFPGSGNAWLRLLIEYSTGIYTGSMGTDDFEFLGPNGFIGERSCGLRLAALRAHPHYFDFVNGKLRFGHTYQRDKCKRGLIRELKRMIILQRNPYDALWSYYQLINSLSHSGYLTTDTFDTSSWMYLAPIMAQHFNTELYRIVKPIIDTYPSEDITFIRYEDLINPYQQEIALKNLLTFMKYDVTDERITCAFLLADQPLIHRNSQDPERVSTKTAYLLSRSTHSHSTIPTTTTGISTSEISHTTTTSTAGTTSSSGSIHSYGVPLTHHRNLLCELREPFAGFAKVLNYTQLLPTSMQDSAYTSDMCSLSLV